MKVYITVDVFDIVDPEVFSIDTGFTSVAAYEEACRDAVLDDWHNWVFSHDLNVSVEATSEEFEAQLPPPDPKAPIPGQHDIFGGVV